MARDPRAQAPALESLAARAGEAILKLYEAPGAVQWKEDDSPLTAADLAAQEVLAAGLAALAPDVPVLSEESAHAPWAERQRWGSFWLVDPLDGTKEFVKRNGEFTVNIALVRDGAPVLGVVHAPVPGATWAGGPGLGAWVVRGGRREAIRVAPPAGKVLRVVASRSHRGEHVDALFEALRRGGYAVEDVSVGSSLKLCLLAEGKAHLYPRFGPTMWWDIAAAQAVLEGAGGEVLRVDGAPLAYAGEDLRNPWFVASAVPAAVWRPLLPTM